MSRKGYDHLRDTNATLDITMDTRTPPRIKQLLKKTEQKKLERVENSHAGVAVPVDEDADILEETVKKMNFYKIEKPTTDGGISTWILLSGQSTLSTSTAKPTARPTQPKQQLQIEVKNSSIITNLNKILKPLFRKRVPSTAKPTTVVYVSSLVPGSLQVAKNSTNETTFGKVKPTTLYHAINVKNSTLLTTATQATTTSSHKTKQEIRQANSSTSLSPLRLEKVELKTELPAEAKEGDLELAASSTTQNPKKTRRTNSKRKKDKTRRRKPTIENKTDNKNKTKIATKTNQKDKTIGTQIYNYLTKDVMHTIGVGILGLVATVGVAGYLLNPLGQLRRSYDIDRKDKEDSYYYDGDYTGGIAEEDAIGKVIAGMPLHDIYKNYRYQNSRNGYSPAHHRQSNVYYTENSERPVYFRDYEKENNSYLKKFYRNDVDTYKNDAISKNVEAMYMANDQQFVPSNVPKDVIEEVTPVAVPEHGPRNVRSGSRNARTLSDAKNQKPKASSSRRRRDVQHDVMSNEIPQDDGAEVLGATQSVSTVTPATPSEENVTQTKQTITHTTNKVNDISSHISEFIRLLREILSLKINSCLQMLRDKATSVSRYFGELQERFNKLP